MRTVTCPNCQRRAKIPTNSPRLRCPCGRTTTAAEFDSPHLLGRITRFTLAGLRHLAAGAPTADAATIKTRLATCHACDFYATDAARCNHPGCGCRAADTTAGWRNKLAWLDQSCPIGHWHAATHAFYDADLWAACEQTPRQYLDLAVTTAADANTFGCLSGLAVALAAGHNVELLVADLGLTTEQRHWLRRAYGPRLTIYTPAPSPAPADDPTWRKPDLMYQSRDHTHHRRLLWLDADTLPLRSLAPIARALDAAPVLTTDTRLPATHAHNHAARNADALYESETTALRLAGLPGRRLNSGVIALDLNRDARLLHAWRDKCAAPTTRPELGNYIRWWDQGAMLWTLERQRRTDLIRFDRPEWNDCGPTLQTDGSTAPTLAVTLENAATRPGSPTILHFAGRPKPQHRNARPHLIDAEHQRRRDLTVYVLGHDPQHQFERLALRHYLRFVDLRRLPPHPSLAEFRAYFSGLPVPDTQYAGFASASWNTKYAAHKIDLLPPDLDLQPDTVWAAYLAPATWPDILERHHPRTHHYTSALAHSVGIAGAGYYRPSAWSNNWIAHRNVWTDLYAWLPDRLDRFRRQAGLRWDSGLDDLTCPPPTDPTRRWGYLAERLVLIYFGQRDDLTLRQI